eukprot:gb/GFBE01054972.1/.p1 GENE.gb/GFBE01054972.1/~~gb/GFBE01054972.1/.p1  ORF type:complete len:183 (+),score=46.88 gb/GFBE01054972.1/:1-549(+)
MARFGMKLLAIALLSAVLPLTFLTWSTGPRAPPRGARVSLVEAPIPDSDMFAEKASGEWAIALASAAAAVGLLLGLFCAPEAASASAQALQGISPFHMPIRKGEMTGREREEINYSLRTLAEQEWKENERRINVGLAEDPKEKRVADAMAQMKEMAQQPIPDQSIYSSYRHPSLGQMGGVGM